jgi:hypothetical protein
MSYAVKTEGQHAGEFLVSEGNGSISREVGTLKSGEKLADGTVLELVGGKLEAAEGTVNTAGASDEVIVGVLFGAHDASSTGPKGAGDMAGVPYIARYAEVNPALLSLSSTAVKNALKALGIISRA